MWANLQYPAKWAAAIGQSHKVLLSAQVWNKTRYIATLPNVTGGSVDEDETRAVRRTCTLTIESQGRPLDKLIPILGDDLLHPTSGNELRLFRGIDYQDNTSDLVPLGVFRISQPKIKDDGQSVNISISGNDRSFWFNRLKWQSPWTVGDGDNLTTTIAAIAQFFMPGVPLNLAPTTAQLAPQTFGLSITQSNQPWLDMVALAATGGFELFFNSQGVLTMRLIVDPTTQQNNKMWAEGPTCTMLDLERDIDESNEFNGVICIANGSGGSPVQGIATVDNPTAINRWGGPWGQVPYIFETSAFPTASESTADSQYRVNMVANQQLQLVNRSFATLNLSCVPDPTVQAGDGGGIVRARMFGTSAIQPIVVSTLSIPFDYSSSQQITTRPRIEV